MLTMTRIFENNTMPKKMPSLVDISAPPFGSPTAKVREIDHTPITAEAASKKVEVESLKTKPASYTIPVYLKEWIQDHADQMTADKNIKGRFTASKLVTQLIKDFKDNVEVKL